MVQINRYRLVPDAKYPLLEISKFNVMGGNGNQVFGNPQDVLFLEMVKNAWNKTIKANTSNSVNETAGKHAAWVL
jgi:hypothetical protein